MPASLIRTKLSDLIIKLLKSLDQYNSTDLTISTLSTDYDTMGERARICLNIGLHKCYDLAKESKYLEAYPTTNIATVAGVDYVELDQEAELDDIEAITETTNSRKLVRRSWGWYRRHVPDPSQVTGNPLYYIRRGDRLYLTPRPNSAITLTIDFNKYMGDLKSGDDQPLFPTHYDGWVIAEAMVEWHKMEDPTAVPPLIIEERDDARKIALGGIFTAYDYSLQSGSNCEPEELSAWPYKRPIPS